MRVKISVSVEENYRYADELRQRDVEIYRQLVDINDEPNSTFTIGTLVTQIANVVNQENE